ncbi:MAG: sporulation protein YqfD [Firmicutes bacterium]|nr:sporulation protein YqfD [Bacillota bacterium]
MITKIKNFLCGKVTFHVENVDATFLNRLRQYSPKEIIYTGELLKFSVALIHKKNVTQILKNHTHTQKHNANIFRTFEFCCNRPLLVFGVLFCFIFVTLLSGFIFRIEINGLEKDEVIQVQSFLYDNGIRRLRWKHNTDTGNLSTAIIQNFDFITHTNVQIRGTTLQINIHRTPTPPPAPVTNLVSLYDAVITQITVLSGIAQVSIGDTVRTGQTLVLAQFQIGVQVGEPDEYGYLTYTQITHPTTAVALIRGKVSHSKSTIIQNESQRASAEQNLFAQIVSQLGTQDFDEKNVYISQLADLSFVVEMVVSRVVDLI